MLIPQYLVLLLKLTPIYTVSINTVFSIPQNQCYPGTPCNMLSISLSVLFSEPKNFGDALAPSAPPLSTAQV